MVRPLVPPIPLAAPTSAPTGDPPDDARCRSPMSNSRSSAPVFLSPAGKPCVICFDMERDGVVCSGTENHFVCRGCLQGFIRNLEPITIRRSGGCVSCPAIEESTGHACDADPWSYDDLVNLLDPSTQRMYVQRLEGLLASVLSAETAITGKAPRSPYRGSIGGGRRSRSVSPLPLSSSSDHDKIQGYRQYIAEEILTLKCPREGCRRAFLDFDGCFALTCPGCGCAFCAACIEDCGDDAHEHCNVVHQGLFGTLDKFNEIQGHRRLVAVTRYLTEVVCVHESRGWVEERLLGPGGALEKDLGEVGIRVQEVKRSLAGEYFLPFGAGGDKGGGGVGKALAVRLGAADDGEQEQQQEQEQEEGLAARQRRRLGELFLKRQGYVATEKDAVSRFLGTVVTASLIVVGVWRLTDVADSTSSTRDRSSSDNEEWGVESTRLIGGAMLGPAMVLLLTGRGNQLIQSLRIALLTALIVIPLFYFSEPLITFVVMILVNVLSVTAHILGMLLDLCVEGARLSKIMLSNLSIEVAALYGLPGVKETLSTVGLLPPVELGLETATS